MHTLRWSHRHTLTHNALTNIPVTYTLSTVTSIPFSPTTPPHVHTLTCRHSRTHALTLLDGRLPAVCLGPSTRRRSRALQRSLTQRGWRRISKVQLSRTQSRAPPRRVGHSTDSGNSAPGSDVGTQLTPANIHPPLSAPLLWTVIGPFIAERPSDNSQGQVGAGQGPSARVSMCPSRPRGFCSRGQPERGTGTQETRPGQEQPAGRSATPHPVLLHSSRGDTPLAATAQRTWLGELQKHGPHVPKTGPPRAPASSPDPTPGFHGA